MSQALTLARPYARAAFAHAREAGQTAQWSNALGLAARIASDPQVQPVLSHPQLAPADAVALLAPNGADEALVRFFSLLADNQRLELLPEIANLFEHQRAEAEGIVRARITSAQVLQADEIERLKTAIRRRFGREVEVETAVDPALIGGAVIDTGDVVIDGSLRGKLERLQTALTT
ncbi:F0F1 ATP synthase subunit delta [Cognatilysobacter bugurensis]|uniref:ATP synthase subunit delta n=1 Tax=Cognatilysobacter bugurensis TaxID=543356 RepID=A0A918SZ12_9GAMM|nr:F0F1 ATP synthase subunit delta [Lysobacter bugurensis]GHA79901.1 ATP synthase subunit delta [Lysobacter bugurensis]